MEELVYFVPIPEMGTFMAVSFVPEYPSPFDVRFIPPSLEVLERIWPSYFVPPTLTPFMGMTGGGGGTSARPLEGQLWPRF